MAFKKPGNSGNFFLLLCGHAIVLTQIILLTWGLNPGLAGNRLGSVHNVGILQLSHRDKFLRHHHFMQTVLNGSAVLHACRAVTA